MVQNKFVTLVSRPKEHPLDSDFQVKTEELEIQDGEALVKNEYIGFDPAQRGWMNENAGYTSPIVLNDVAIRGGGIGTVIESKSEEFPVGTLVSGLLSWQQYAIVTKDRTIKGQIPMTVNKVPEGFPTKSWMNELGMVGLTAYFGTTEDVAGKINPGDVVVVSGAAGAVGSLVGQIAKIKGAYVIGIAGGKEKVDLIKNQLGFDEGIDYKNENVHDRLKELAPKGINLYFDNVGGSILEACLANTKLGARVVACGFISSYNGQGAAGPKNYSLLVINRLTIKGFLVFDYASEFQTGIKQLMQWTKEGKLKPLEDIQEGFDNIIPTFRRLFTGQNVGKQLLKL